MKKLFLMRNLFLLILSTFLVTGLNAQCETWVGSPNEGAITDAHTIYRGHVKAKQFDEAFEFWETAYKGAPAADGGRDFHYTDGIKIYMHKFKNATDEAKKAEYSAAIIRLYNEARDCFTSGAIKMKGADKRVGYFLGREAFDRYYELRTPYTETFEVLKEAVKVAGNDTEYIVLAPYADVAVYMFTNELIDKAATREVHDLINKIGSHNAKSNEKYGAYYTQALESANGSFAQIADNIFDCEYFMPEIKANYEANPDDPTTIETAIREMKRKACDPSDAFLVMLEGKYSQYAAAENARRKSEFEANNPAMMAKKAKEAGDYNGAIAKYNEAIAAESDPSKQALYHYQIGQIKGKKMKDFSGGKAAANKAIQLRPDWGPPHMLIGDLYISNSKRCGDAIKQKCCYIAAVDKYRKAKSVDPESAAKASEKISRYAGTRPEKENAFMQGYKEGQTISLPCIGTSVKLRF